MVSKKCILEENVNQSFKKGSFAFCRAELADFNVETRLLNIKNRKNTDLNSCKFTRKSIKVVHSVAFLLPAHILSVAS